MQSIREELHLERGIRLKGDSNLPGDGLPSSVEGLRHLDADEAGCCRHIVLPAAPEHGIALAHEKAIARVLVADGTVQIRQHGGSAAIDDIQEQEPPLIAALGRDGLQQADVRRAMHQALRIAWGALQVSDAGVAGMVRVDRAVYCAIQLLVGANVTKGLLWRKGAAGLDLQGCYRHVTPPFP